MASDVLIALGEANLAAAIAILVVAALRLPTRALFGARTAYALWLIAPAAMLATFLPTRTLVAMGVTEPAAVARPEGPLFLLALWLAGMAIGFARLAAGHRAMIGAFGPVALDPDIGASRATLPVPGPALVGVLRPRIIVPPDFETRFDAAERAMILDHERTHLAHGHALTNGLIAVVQAVNWFNPLVHFAARLARVDQELACDAAVVARRPEQRRVYARALLKAQLGAAPVPLGCHWPPSSAGLLEKRIEMLASAAPGEGRLGLGACAVASLSLVCGAAAWAAQPPSIVAPANEPVQAALASGDLLQAARLGATLRQMVLAEQAHGRLLDVDPDAPDYAAFAFNGRYFRLPVRPLPPIEGLDAGARTLPLAGPSFGAP